MLVRIRTWKSLVPGLGKILAVVSAGLLAPCANVHADAIILSFENNIGFSENSTLTLKIIGTETGFDHQLLDVHQTATLEGTLDIEFINDFSPRIGDEFLMIRAATRVGMFKQINDVLRTGNDLALAPVYDYQGTTGLTMITALPGDIDFSGSVDQSDLDILFANIGSDGDWTSGNVNGDNRIDLHDMEIIFRNLGRTVPSTNPSAASTPVPEPATLTILALGAMIGLRRRRR